jgi:hypothetical protein
VVDEEIAKKEKARKYKIHKSGKVEKIQQHLMFCDQEEKAQEA